MANLSKSQYVKGRRCLRRLWLSHFHPERATPSSPFRDQILEQGNEVGQLAHALFPGGEHVHEDHSQPEAALSHTVRALGEGKSILYEAAFCHDGVLVRTDILVRTPTGAWDLYEVKSSTNRTKPRKEHLLDLAIQKYVLSGAGLPLANTFLVRLNRHYQKSGHLDPHTLFVAEPMDEHLEEPLRETAPHLAIQRQALGQNLLPPAALGSICKSPYPCEFKSHCWEGLPRDSIHTLCFARDSLRTKLLEAGIETLGAIPEDWLRDDRQKRQVRSQLKPQQDRERIRTHLSSLRHPLYFLDFETYGYALPQFEGTRPYQRLPFQFSVHAQLSPGAPYTHHEFLCDQPMDPRPQCVEELLKTIGQTGSVVAYHASFERGVIEELAHDFPPHRDALLAIASRLWDLETPFSERWICRAEFGGKSSIKTVLPALVPKLDYSDLAIQSGDEAMRVYLELLNAESDSDREQKRQTLLAYCKRDSWAMVKVLESLIIESEAPRA